ncbi:rhomboid family intramembrane serine protease [Marinimicrobium sp. ABcell2]|uniref:rhomboid family intramembrane serine protease n=1 Tax=Marinimicrobium sp. ABcell2 TaxID=3069751 RepID=UPI0027B45FF9|nr:rhomboid family intramembrane serine protease [Marinimicrobium sp. ABcell2]MDQ2078009.1 rhomboid family intramembrane serine protease [Marinimicrobium sp. ABcell2]
MSWTPVKQLPISKDLSGLSRFLRSRGFVHRITEEGDRQMLWVDDPAMAEPVASLTERWLSGEFDAPQEQSRQSPPLIRFGPSPNQAPLTLVLLALSVLGALAVMTPWAEVLVPMLTFQDFTLRMTGPEFVPVAEGIGSGELWRLFTPAFLHFGIFHIVFNGLWLWELGRRLEVAVGWRQYLMFVLITGTLANIAQYYWSGPSLFGGMSGVVYALVGYIWMRQRQAPHPVLAVPPGIIGFMLVFLIIGLTGIIDQFMQGSVANGAHVGGLMAGMAWGILGSKR